MEGIVELPETRTLVPRRVWLILFVALLIALVAAFAYVVVHFQNESRHQAQIRFAEEASLTAQFTSALLSTTASSSGAAVAKEFAGATIPKTVKSTPGAAYTVILDAHGARLGASKGAPATAGPSGAVYVRRALAGRAWFSDLIPRPKAKDDLFEWAIPFTTPAGRRVAVEGIPVASVAFLSHLLPTSGALVLDSRHHVIASTSATLKTGQLPKSTGLLHALDTKQQGSYHYANTDRYFSSAPLEGTTWSVVMATTTSALYPALAGSKSWILYAVLAGFALACVASAVFFRRALVAGVELQRTNTTLEQMNVTLEDRVAERTAAAEDRARELTRSNQELEQFSSVASHDLQEPLRKVRMFGDRLRDRLGAAISAEAAEDLERMQNAAERMQVLINDLLDFSRVTHRGQPFAEVDLGEVATEVVSDLEARIVELDATVDIGALPTVHADRTQMRQLLQNLIANALKFHREDVPPVVRVDAETIPAQAPRFAAEKVAGDRYVLTVKDNGIGFDEQYAERIFSPFERLHARAAYEGTGIGLSIARKIVWRHGGHIAATSVPGEGATFTITLPLTPNGGKE